MSDNPSEAVVRRCSVKKVFSKISQNSQENTCGRVSLLIKLPASASGIFVSSKIIEDKGDDENWNYKRDRQVRAFLIRVLKACNFTKKRFQHVFSCEHCEIFKNTYFNRTPLLAASVSLIKVNNFPNALHFITLPSNSNSC